MDFSPQTFPRRSFGRCARGARRALAACLWGALALQILVCVGLWRNDAVSLPDTLADAFEGALAHEGLWLDAEDVRLTSAGWFCARNVRLFADARKTDLILRARTLAVLPVRHKLLYGRFEPRRLEIAGGKLACPAFLSPNGKSETLVENVVLSAAFKDGKLRLDTFSCALFNARIRAHGEALLPKGESASERAPAAASKTLVRQIESVFAPLLKAREILAQFDNPIADLEARVADGQTELSLTLLADGWRNAELNAQTGPIAARLEALYDGARLRACGRSHIEARDIAAAFQSGGAAQTVAVERARLDLLGADEWDGRPETLFCGARAAVFNARAFGAEISALNADIDARGYPLLSASGRVRAGAGDIGIKASFNAKNRSGEVALSGAVDPRALLPPDLIQDEGLKRVRFGAPPEWEIAAFFSENLRFDRAEAVLRLYETQYDSVRLRAAFARCEATADSLRARDIALWGDGFKFGGEFRQNFKRSTYRFLLRGTVAPHQLDSLMEPWWLDIWREFDVEGNAPYADIDFGGQWGNDLESVLVGCVRLNDFGFRTERWQSGSVGLRITPDYTAIDDIALVCGKGTLCGDFRWFYKNDMRPRLMFSQQLSIRSDIPLDLLGAVGGDDVAAIARELRSDVPPQLEGEFYTWGVGSAVAGDCFIDLKARFPEKGAIFNIPVERVRLRARIDNRRVRFADIEMGLSGGRATGALTLTDSPNGARADFDFALENANHLRFFDDVAQMAAADELEKRKPSPQKTPTAEETAARNRGKFRLSAKGSGVFGHTDAFNGTGAFEISDAEIGTFDLLGGLSRALRGTGLPSGQLSFTDAKGDLRLENGVLVFPNLRVSGDYETVDAAGRVSLVDQSLNFRLHFYPLAAAEAPFVRFVSKATHPISHTFALTLDGTTKKPDWHIDFSPSRMFTFDFVAPEMPESPAKNP